MSRLFKAAGEIGLSRQDVEAAIEMWLEKFSLSGADKVTKITLHPDAKYIVRATFNGEASDRKPEGPNNDTET